MNFFKKLFSSKKQEVNPEKQENQTNFKGIETEEYFNKRYQEEHIDESILVNSLKMIESYFIDNKIERKISDSINHPVNLDQTINEGFGFALYCKAFDFEENHAYMFLVMAFNDYMIKNHNFKLYKDAQPEYPFRNMTLKYDKDGANLSLYPIEYTGKVMRHEANYEDLYERIKNNIGNMPNVNDVLNKFLSQEDE